MRRRIATGTTIVAAALLFAGPLPSVAQNAATPAIVITPPRVERDSPDGTVAQTFSVTDDGSTPLRVALTVSGLGHSLDGTPLFLDPDPVQDEIRVSPASLTLAAGESRTVTVAGRIPPSHPGAYAAIVAEASAGSAVERVAALLLLRGPTPWTQTAAIVGAGLEPGTAAGTIGVYAAVANTGNVHLRPAAVATIRAGDATLATVALSPQVVLPGFARRLTGAWTPPPGFAGPVRIDVRMDDPTATGTGAGAVLAGNASGPRGAITALDVRREGGALVTGEVRNIGTEPFTPVITLIATQGGVERARTILVQTPIAPGSAEGFEWLAAVEDGDYLVTAQLDSGETLLDQTAAATRLAPGVQAAAGAEPTGATRTALVAVAVALQIGTLAGLLVASMRRRRGAHRAGARTAAV